MENKKTPPNLQELQQWMRWIITDPRGVEQALSDPFPAPRSQLERYTSPTKTALPWIEVVKPIPTTARLDIYAEAYFIRILESMKSDFQITSRILGQVSFQKLVADYLKKYPSQTYNIGEVGRHFSKFIVDYEDLKGSNFLISLAEMEWKFIQSFYANDSGELTPSKLNELTENDWSLAQFIFAPSIHLIESTWPLDQFWSLRNKSIELDAIHFIEDKTSHGFLIFRENDLCNLEKLSHPELFILKNLMARGNLLETLENAQNIFCEQDIESKIMVWFNSWVHRGIIFDIKINNEKEIK